MALKPLTVSQLNSYIRSIVIKDPLLRTISVSGEITNVSFSKKGHEYITLSDGTSRVECVLYTDMITPGHENDYKKSDKVIVTGRVDVYVPYGSYSVIIDRIEHEGLGEMAAAFAELSRKLEAEGLFDKKHKKPLPAFPKHIAVVTSATGAAVKDILKIISSRTAMTHVTVFPVLVQGAEAARDMTDALKTIETEYAGDVDLIIIGRGGGSPEDLMAFNDEGLARAIYACGIPVISGVGHEIDRSITDFVADAYAETPTAAAQMAVPEDAAVSRDADSLMGSINLYVSNRLIRKNSEAEALLGELTFAVKDRLNRLDAETERLYSEIKRKDPRTAIAEGCAVITDSAGRQVASASSLSAGEKVDIIFSDGMALCTVDEVRRGNSKAGKESRSNG